MKPATQAAASGPVASGTGADLRRTDRGWWQARTTLARWSRDVLCAEMAQLRPGGWPWPHHAADVHLVEDAGADSLEMMALSSAWAERLDLREACELQAMMQRPSWQAWTEVAHQRLMRDDTWMRFATSGSTGRAQTVVHALDSLLEEVDCILQRLQHRGPTVRRIVSTVRAHHIYGFLFTVLLPRALAPSTAGAGLPLIDAVGQPPSLVCGQLQPGDLLVAFPEWWAQALRQTAPWPADVTGVSSTAPCPTATAQAAMRLAVARWIEVYGSTETAGVGWREDPQQPFELQPYWSRVPADTEAPGASPDGDGDGAEDGTGADAWGLIRLSARPRIEAGHAQPVPTPDHLRWVGDRHFWPQGRRDGMVQVAGVNVDPGHVAARLRQHPAVADAAVRLHETPAGPRLKAFVVPNTGLMHETFASSTAPMAAGPLDPAEEHGRSAPAHPANAGVEDLRHELEAWCRQQFVPAARPVHIRLGQALPRNDMGKLCDWPLQA